MIGQGTDVPLLLLEHTPESCERAMQRHVDRVRFEAEDGADLARAEIGPVPQSEKIAASLIERRHRRCDREALDGAVREITRCFLLDLTVTR